MEKIVHDVETQEVTIVNLTSAEVAAITKQQAEAQKVEAEQAQAQAEAEAAKAAAQAKLAALGLTTDDLKALGLGGN